MLKHMQKITTPIGSKAKAEHPELIERGVFVRKELPEYCEAYDTIIRRAKEGK
jgi:2-oxoglutarate ferredoxin oxidoreductase subunit beta